IDLPHDFAVALPFVNDADLYQFGFKPIGRKYPETSIGWYRRVFEMPQSDLGRRIALEFDGIFRDAMVVLNGIYLGRNLSGYAPFRFDVTDFVNYSGKNVLAVRADATEHEGWFYEGAGIYRHVWLTKTDPLHIAHWGTYATAAVSGNSATVSVATEIENEQDAAKSFRLKHAVFDSSGRPAAEWESARNSIGASERRTISQEMRVENPSLWSLESPHLYRLVTTVESENGIVDEYQTRFGIRMMRFDADKGFFLNGERVEIKGTCNHQDHAGVGSALPDRLQYFRIAKLKEMGANAYRTSHNPPTLEMLDACDELGMLVMDETRMFSSSREGLSQLERMVRRDRNHPCIFIWSLGNEEPLQGTPTGERVAATMKRLVRRLDPSRPVTLAMNGSWGKGASNVVDVQGWNYFRLGDEDKFHAAFPQKPLIGSEDASALSTRGIYANDPEHGYMSSYDANKPSWGSLAQEWWNFYSARPFAAGAFAWTGFDYRGEPTPYKWPCISSHFGIMDTCGFPKDTYFYYQAWWTNKTVLHLFPHWNWQGKEGQSIQVWVHSNLDRVELRLNGKAVDPGVQHVTRGGHVEWKVPYAAGTLEARGYTGDRLVLTARRETTGAAAAIQLAPDRSRIAADGRDVSVVEVRVTDVSRRTVPTAHDAITFRVSGAGRLIGVGNGDPSSHEADHADTRSVFNGLCCAIVQAARDVGEIRLEASAPGLKGAVAVISAVKG